MNNKKILEVNGISKRFGGIQALKDVSLHLNKGEILGLVGENGAGKSTLIKILGGAIKQDTGDILIDYKKVELTNPRTAIDYGISVIYQELNLVPSLSIAKNIFLGNPPMNRFLKVIYNSELNKSAEKLLDSLGVKLDPRILIRNISVAHKQIVEICKAITFNTNILILDEPTSSLSEKEIDQLFELLNKLQQRGISIIFISHRLEEVMRLVDRINVLRNGQLVSDKKKKETNINSIISNMIGRGLKELYPKTKAEIGGKFLEVRGLGDGKVFKNVSIYVKKGEIVGIAGPIGSGRTELLKTIFGSIKKTCGKIFINDKEVKINNVIDSIQVGLGYVPEDRQIEGLISSFLVSENIYLPNLKKISNIGVLVTKKIKELVNIWIRKLKIATYNPFRQKIRELSGGNQQKVVISKWLATGAKLLLLDEPTKGIDVGTKSEIHKLIGKFIKEGNSVIIVSSEIDELLSVCDRIYIMIRGKINSCFEKNKIDHEKLMNYVLGRV